MSTYFQRGVFNRTWDHLLVIFTSSHRQKPTSDSGWKKTGKSSAVSWTKGLWTNSNASNNPQVAKAPKTSGSKAWLHLSFKFPAGINKQLVWLHGVGPNHQSEGCLSNKIQVPQSSSGERMGIDGNWWKWQHRGKMDNFVAISHPKSSIPQGEYQGKRPSWGVCGTLIWENHPNTKILGPFQSRKNSIMGVFTWPTSRQAFDNLQSTILLLQSLSIDAWSLTLLGKSLYLMSPW